MGHRKESHQYEIELTELVKNLILLANELIVTNKYMTLGVDKIIEAFISRLSEAFKQQKDGLTQAQQREKECVSDLERKTTDIKNRTETISIELERLQIALDEVESLEN